LLADPARHSELLQAQRFSGKASNLLAVPEILFLTQRSAARHIDFLAGTAFC
jgi:hypothetical protein